MIHNYNRNRFLRESGEDVDAFLEEVERLYHRYFPRSKIDANVVSILGLRIYIDCYLAGDKSEVPYGIWRNDMFQVSLYIDLTRDRQFYDPIVLEGSESWVKARSESRYHSFDMLKVPFRKTKGDTRKILQALDKYFARLKGTLVRLDDEGLVREEDQSLVDKKLR